MNRFHKILSAILVAGFLAGISHLMVLRFERGDVYPAYSSLRSDPVGTRAFYDSLENLSGIGVTRNYRPLESLGNGAGKTLFFIGAQLRAANDITLAEAQILDRFMSSGGRVVVTMMPAAFKSRERQNRSEKKNEGVDSEPEKKAPANNANPQNESHDAGTTEKDPEVPEPSGSQPFEEEDTETIHTSLKEQWGIYIETDPEPDDTPRTEATGYAASLSGKLPRVLSWHSPVYFSELTDAWKILYTADGEPVMVERQIGRGSLAMATDSYFMSNEALKSERYPELLLYLIGTNSVVIVDEAHHGIQRRQGMIGYLRQHQLHWIIIALLAIAALFVWRNASPLVPPERHPAGNEPKAAESRNAAQGMTNLLQRSISPRKLLSVCFDQWEKAFEKNLRYPQTRREQARRIIEKAATAPGVKLDPVNGYRAVSRILLEDKPNE